MITLNETKAAECILEQGVVGDKPMRDIALCIKYYYAQARVIGKQLNTNDIIREMQNLLQGKYDNCYSIEWYDRIAACIKKYKNVPLYDFEYIPITQKELEIIGRVGNKKLEKLIFTCLVFAKYYNMRNTKNDNYVNMDYATIFNLARVTATTYIQPLLLNDLKNMGLVIRCTKVDNPNFKVTFVDMDSNSPVAIKVTDVRELGYQYLQYKGEAFIQCAECGVLMRKRSNNNKYCKNCCGYQPQIAKKKICEECGIEFFVSSKNTKTTRCDKCKRVHRKAYQRDLMRRKRNF